MLTRALPLHAGPMCRDFINEALDYDAPGSLMVAPFTEKMPEFAQFVSGIEAAGGSDVPEDLCGGLEEASKLDWTGQSRHLFLLSDAPCHGNKYHLKISDNFPDGDPHGRQPENQLCEMLSQATDGDTSFKVTFLKLAAGQTDKMIKVRNRAVLALRALVLLPGTFARTRTHTSARRTQRAKPRTRCVLVTPSPRCGAGSVLGRRFSTTTASSSSATRRWRSRSWT